MYNSKNHNVDTLNRKNTVFITQIKQNLDTKFIMARNVLNYMRYNEYLIDYSKKEDIDYYLAFKLKSTLSQSQTSFSELGYIVSMIKENTNMVITPYGTRNLKDFLLETGIPIHNLGAIKESFNKGWELPVIEGYLESSLDTSDSPFIGKSITILQSINSGEANLLFFLVFYEESIFPKNIVNKDEALILFENKRILMNSSTIDPFIVKDFFDTGTLPEDYNIYISKSNVIPNGGILYITPKNRWKEFPKSDLIKSSVIYLILVLFSIILSIILTKKSYQPIGTILDTLNYEGTDRDEFKFIQDTTKKIQDANTELTKSILDEKIPLRVKFLRDCLNGLIRKDEIEKNLNKYNIKVTTDKITAVIIHFNDDEELMNNFTNETITNIRNKVSYIIKEHLTLKCNFELVEISYLSSTAIIFDLDESELRTIFNKILLELSSNAELDITVSMGITVNKFINLKRSYFSAMSELDKWSGISKNLLPALNEDKDNRSVSFFYPLETERRIIKYVTAGKDESISLIHSILERNSDSLHLSKKEWESFVRAMIRTIKRVLTQLNRPENMIIGDSTSLTDYIISESRSSEVNNILDVFRNILKYIKETSLGEQKTFADKLLKYIKQNYSDPNLSLIDIAEYFTLSPAYISRIFKDYTGRNFKDLLSHERVSISKELLKQNPNIKVYNLGTKVGFNSTNTFLRTFKKYTGISPGKFAKTLSDPDELD
ncbi:MAG: AraC family transcriptional regulator [Spirochaetaceae bacterium]